MPTSVAMSWFSAPVFVDALYNHRVPAEAAVVLAAPLHSAHSTAVVLELPVLQPQQAHGPVPDVRAPLALLQPDLLTLPVSSVVESVAWRHHHRPVPTREFVTGKDNWEAHHVQRITLSFLQRCSLFYFSELLLLLAKQLVFFHNSDTVLQTVRQRANRPHERVS